MENWLLLLVIVREVVVGNRELDMLPDGHNAFLCLFRVHG